MQEREKNEEIEINLGEIFGLLLHKIWLIIVAGVLCGVAGFAISSLVITPKYQSTTKAYILNKQSTGTVTYSDVQLSSTLSKDYLELVKSRTVLESVIRQLGLNDTYESLSGKVSVSSATDTRIISISVTDTDPEKAQKVANAVRDAAAKHITDVMDIEAVNVVDAANLPSSPVSPSVSKWTVIFAFIGILIVAAVIVIKYLLDDTIKSSDDIEKYLGLSTLALIPMNDEKTANNKKYKTPSTGRSENVELKDSQPSSRKIKADSKPAQGKNRQSSNTVNKKTTQNKPNNNISMEDLDGIEFIEDRMN